MPIEGFRWGTGLTSPQNLQLIWATQGCAGMLALFNGHLSEDPPIPVGQFDLGYSEENCGEGCYAEITGWVLICGGEVQAQGGEILGGFNGSTHPLPGPANQQPHVEIFHGLCECE